ncbi:hypothetical protein [Actinocrispum wychmicini]|uniref:Uncharacterized protein n=1 Tax=Actinocrispum wychmicini TaxID=1213861 RepID=A0A4R2JZG3_9PSEU|nr:hypothetical protein [Actinocrispum wychmicini]TCO62838.1 hypothetical protein EV192_102977 [Actinocrispum wychmicini]
MADQTSRSHDNVLRGLVSDSPHRARCASSPKPLRHPQFATARTRLAVAVLMVGSAGLVGVAVSGQAATPPGLDFIQVGHWVFHDGLQSAFHVDGSTNQVDAQVPVPGVERGSQVVQGDRAGYVVERSRITEFDKSTLSVDNASTPPAVEQPAVLEVAGGPYLVYRNAGQIVRLGDPAATVPAGGPLSTPVATGEHGPDGATVWVHRIDTGSLCDLPKAAIRLACPAQLPEGHAGSLTVVDDRPTVVDITSKTVRVIGKDGFGESTAIGVDLPVTAQIATGTVDGWLAALDPEHNRLHLIDTAGLANRPAVKPVAVDLPKDGKFAAPVVSERTIALVDQTRNELLTYDSNGALKSTTKVPGEGGAPRASRGEDGRIYVDSADGSHLLVVNSDSGAVANVSVALPITSSASPVTRSTAPASSASLAPVAVKPTAPPSTTTFTTTVSVPQPSGPPALQLIPLLSYTAEGEHTRAKYYTTTSQRPPPQHDPPYRQTATLGQIATRSYPGTRLLIACEEDWGAERTTVDSGTCPSEFTKTADLGWIFSSPPEAHPSAPLYRCAHKYFGASYDTLESRCSDDVKSERLGYVVTG